MGFEIINKLKKERGLTNADISRLSGVTVSTLDKITSGYNTNPKRETLLAICDVLGCTLNDFSNKPISPAPGITSEEYAYIEKYRGLDGHGQRIVDLVLDEEHQRCTQPVKPAFELVQEPKEVVDLYEFIAPVSAGFGTDLTGLDGAVKTRVVSNVYTKQADFILRVSGESMAPRFHNNDKILVHETDDVDTGEIGVWMIDGKSYVKKKGEGRLISLNRKYPDVYPDKTYEQTCQGRVVGVLDPSWIVEENVEE